MCMYVRVSRPTFKFRFHQNQFYLILIYPTRHLGPNIRKYEPIRIITVLAVRSTHAHTHMLACFQTPLQAVAKPKDRQDKQLGIDVSTHAHTY